MNEDTIKKMSAKEWNAEAEKRFGKDRKNWKFKCVNCGNTQSIKDFIKLGVEKPETYVYFSCIGRFIDNCKGTIGNKISPCNYTLGGLFNFAKVIVIDDGGEEHTVFEFADVGVGKP